MRKREKKTFLFLLTFLALFLWANFFILHSNAVATEGVFAQDETARELEIKYPTVPGTTTPTTVETGLPQYVKYIFNFAIWIAGLLAFGVIVLGGIRWLTSAGDPNKLRDAKDQLFAAFLGLIILLSSYLILTTINPQLVLFEALPLRAVELKSPPAPIPEIEKITTSINVELPSGSMVENRIFPEERMTRIKKIAADTEKTSTESVRPGKSLACLTVMDKDACKEVDMSVDDTTIGCFCDSGCVTPVCIVSCCCKCTCLIGCCCASCGCGPCGCSSDPCCKPRSKISENEEILQNKIGDLLSLQKKSNEEAGDLRVEVDKLEKALKIMEECPIWGLNSMSEFISLKDEYQKEDWKLKKINYWDYINAGRNPATFYCPIGGTRSAYVPESEIPPEEFEKASQEFEKSLGGGEMLVNCQEPIPFGEIIDKTIAVANKLIKEIEELIELNQKMVSAIDHLTQLVDQCTSKNCTCGCGCGKGCACTPPPRCSGNPCPSGIPEAAEEIKKIKDEIATKRSEIDKTIDEEVPPVLKELKKAEELIYPCVSQETVEPEWLLLDCERAIGNVGPDGKKIKNAEECQCKEDEKCQENFETIKDYQCQEIGDCYSYNLFCCRAKD